MPSRCLLGLIACHLWGPGPSKIIDFPSVCSTFSTLGLLAHDLAYLPLCGVLSASSSALLRASRGFLGFSRGPLGPPSDPLGAPTPFTFRMSASLRKILSRILPIVRHLILILSLFNRCECHLDTIWLHVMLYFVPRSLQNH